MLFAVQSSLPVKHILGLPRMAKTMINFFKEVCIQITSVTEFSDKGTGKINLAAWSTLQLHHSHLHLCEHTHMLSIKGKKRKKIKKA